MPPTAHGCPRARARYANGVLEVLAEDLVRYVASSDAVADFVSRPSVPLDATAGGGSATWSTAPSANASGALSGARARAAGAVRLSDGRQGEDVALGFWLSAPVLRATAGAPPNVTYVRVNDRASNMACLSTSGLYQRPQNDSVAIHFLKRPSAMQYVWRLLHDRQPHESKACARAVWGSKRR